MDLRDEIIRCLADGEIRSGSAIARTLRVSRGAVWKHVQTLSGLGIDVTAVAGRGYQLARRLELLSGAAIMTALDDEIAAAIEDLTVLSVTDSTNTRLAAAVCPMPDRMRVCLAEFQTDGRGRRGRKWVSSYATGVCLSISWCLEAIPRQLPALSPALAVMVGRALADAGAAGVQLKWPNDLVFDGGKLGGILVDVAGESAGPLKVVIGVGLNLSVPRRMARVVAGYGGLPAAGLELTLAGQPVSRNRLAGLLLTALWSGLRQFERQGFEAFIDEWRRQDYLSDKLVSIRDADGIRRGFARGIGPDGSLLVETASGITPLLSGEVSVRHAA